MFYAPMPAYATLADLWRAQASMLVQCGGCRRYKTVQTSQISAPERIGTMPPVYETILITEAVLRMKCRECGGRVDNWQPVMNVHGGMASG